jgi:GNAT superfamily N-acetyltransferase
MRSSEHLEIRIGLPEHYRRQAAALCYEAFRTKFEPILGAVEHGVAILERGLEPELIATALVHDRLVGLVGLEYDERYFFNPKIVTFAREFGWLSGLLRCIIFSPFARHRRAGDLTVGAFAVDAPMRGKGIGTRLMEAVFDWARGRGFHSLSLEVVDTNPAARRLYERLGFAPIKTQQLPYPFRRLGFSAVTTMIKDIA